jgi:hypothetical protein
MRQSPRATTPSSTIVDEGFLFRKESTVNDDNDDDGDDDDGNDDNADNLNDNDRRVCAC